MELVVAEVERGVDGLERLEVEVHPLLLALVRHNRPAVDYQTVRGHSRVQPDIIQTKTTQEINKKKRN